MICFPNSVRLEWCGTLTSRHLPLGWKLTHRQNAADANKNDTQLIGGFASGIVNSCKSGESFFEPYPSSGYLDFPFLFKFSLKWGCVLRWNYARLLRASKRHFY